MKKIALVLGTALVLCTAGAFAEEKAAEKKADDKPTTGAVAKAEEGKPVGNKHCPVMPEEVIGPKSKSVTYKGQTVKLCCGKCVRKFNQNPEEYLKKAQEDAKANP